MKQIVILLLCMTLNAQVITTDGVGSNSDKTIAKERALLDAKVSALNSAGVYIESELELTEQEDLNGFKDKIKSKILQKSDGLVTLIKIIDSNVKKDSQIYTYKIKAKFDVKKSDIKNSFEIMKKLEDLSQSKIGQDEYNKLLKEIKNLKTKISNPQLSKIINKNSNKIINNIDVLVNNQIDNKVVVENTTDKLLYYIVAGLFFIILFLLYLSNRKKDIVVTHIVENPTLEDIADISKQNDEIIVSLNKKVYTEGDKLVLSLRVNSKKENLYVYAYNLDTNDEIVLLKLMKFGDRIKANKEYSFPDYADGFGIVAPFGRDIIKVFVSDTELKVPNISKDVKSSRFESLNTKGLSNPDDTTISQYDIVEYFNRFSVLQNSIAYRTKGEE